MLLFCVVCSESCGVAVLVFCIVIAVGDRLCGAKSNAAFVPTRGDNKLTRVG